MALNLPQAIYAIRWLVRDTFRQSLASYLFWVMLGVSALCIVLCLSAGAVRDERLPLGKGEVRERLPASDPQAADPEKARRHGVDVLGKEQLTLAFGAIRIQLPRDVEDAFTYLQLILASWVADVMGVLLALVWTAGFLPTFLEPGAASVLLAKPVPRWSLLVGKYLGVLAFVGFQALVFVVGTWVALGLKSGVWTGYYLLCVPLLLLQFAIFFSFSTLLAVCTRSTVACVIGSILFWFLCWGMNYGRHALKGLAPSEGLTVSGSGLVEVGYWVLPKPADMSVVVFDTLHASHFFAPKEFSEVQRLGAFHPELSVLASALFAVFVLVAAAHQFVTTDY